MHGAGFGQGLGYFLTVYCMHIMLSCFNYTTVLIMCISTKVISLIMIKSSYSMSRAVSNIF